jgi:hypothetical protein
MSCSTVLAFWSEDGGVKGVGVRGAGGVEDDFVTMAGRADRLVLAGVVLPNEVLPDSCILIAASCLCQFSLKAQANLQIQQAAALARLIAKLSTVVLHQDQHLPYFELRGY